MKSCSSIFFLSYFSFCFSQKSRPCPSSLTLDISNAVELPNNRGVFQQDNSIYNQSNYYMDDSGRRMGCLCNIKKCIRKCCGRDMYMNKTKGGTYKCIEKNVNFSIDFFTDKQPNHKLNLNNFSMIFGYDCPVGFNRIPVHSNKTIFMQENGTLYYDDGDLWKGLYHLDLYCVDLLNCEILAILCEPEDEQAEIQRTVNGIGLFISMPFLFITFLVYAILPERNLHRRGLMCYVICALAANITLLIIQSYPYKFPEVSCHLIGYLIIFFFLASFFWLNVMCFDMWLTFSSSIGFLSKKTEERKKFIIYSVYAWGTPLCFVLIVLIINTYAKQTAHYHPQIGILCFLKEGWPKFYYFYLPLTILVSLNIILFIATSIKIFKIKRATKMLKRTDSKIHTYEEEQKYKLYVKLIFAMGVNWIMEIISWAVVWKTEQTYAAIFYITDFTNAMYGFLIFLIFVFKKKIWRGLQKRYYEIIGKTDISPLTSDRTRTSKYSTNAIISAVNYDQTVNSSPRASEEIRLHRK